MKPIKLLSLTALLACSLSTVIQAPAAERQDMFVTILSGDEEVPPNSSRAQGVVLIRLNEAGTQLEYKLIVANIQNVTAAHIHLAPAGSNGGVVAFLAGNYPPGAGRFSGVLAQGVISETDLRGALAGKSIADLVAEMKAGNAYVNVHTNDGVPPTNTGPGDLAAGEIRGQIRDVGSLAQ